MEVGTSLARHPLRLLARRVCALPQRLLEKVYGSRAYVEMQICLDCSFVQTKYTFPDDAIGRLYADYRSATYNQERIHYEPTYAAFAKDVGACDQEVQVRVGGLTAWLADKIDSESGSDFTILDFGGSDGRFLPKLHGRKYVFEISDIAPLEGIARIANEADLATYSYVQLAHVLEHVPEPLALVKHVSSFVKPSGYLYIEVPQELTDAEFAALKSGKARRGLPIHEHINMFCLPAVTRLVQAAGLDLLSVQSAPIDIGWAASTIIRALCRKRA
jgi:SAM-dependent methyltransferase